MCGTIGDNNNTTPQHDNFVVVGRDIDGNPADGGFQELQVEINEEKTVVVDLAKGESFGFLGFVFRRARSVSTGRWRPLYTPKLEKRTALLRKLKDIFRRFRSQPVTRVIELINPILRGWVRYSAVGHSSRLFLSFVTGWKRRCGGI